MRAQFATLPHGRGSSPRLAYVALLWQVESMTQAQPEASKELIVFSILRESKCTECGVEIWRGDLLSMESGKPLCMKCADLDHLVVLPRGDTALTRRAKKHSGLWAVILRFSRARKRYERQGLLVEQAALNRGGGVRSRCSRARGTTRSCCRTPCRRRPQTGREHDGRDPRTFFPAAARRRRCQLPPTPRCAAAGEWGEPQPDNRSIRGYHRGGSGGNPPQTHALRRTIDGGGTAV
uniref:DUF2293 domain-containing protein n=1 Tax=Solibacter usitatus (strain Ellin6076) TaxID=234267 RepID=Q01Y87_SOLUE